MHSNSFQTVCREVGKLFGYNFLIKIALRELIQISDIINMLCEFCDDCLKNLNTSAKTTLSSPNTQISEIVEVKFLFESEDSNSITINSSIPIYYNIKYVAKRVILNDGIAF